MNPVVQDHSQKTHCQYRSKRDLLDPTVGAYLEDKMAGAVGKSIKKIIIHMPAHTNVYVIYIATVNKMKG